VFLCWSKRKKSVSSNSINQKKKSSMSTKSSISSRQSRQSIHPLLQYDPEALNGGIQLLRLEYLEAETTRAPVPRNQEVPKEAFGTLTGRSILVATSHAWFFQCHPDPYGVKLKIMRQKFFPSLRRRFPHTQILVFDDWHSCPQWPRITKEENDRFKKCMDHMNSIYCYCDVVLFVESPLPKLDHTILTCVLVPSEHKWLHFIDTIQYIGGNDKTLAIRKNDIVVKIKDEERVLQIDTLKKMKETTTISFLRRPYGRPNRVLAKDRGWLYAERITVAIRMAGMRNYHVLRLHYHALRFTHTRTHNTAARPEMFDDVVRTNNKELYGKMLTWTVALRSAVQLEKSSPHTESVRFMLEAFECVLSTMKFTFPADTALVREIMHKVIERFTSDWKEESKRQNDMAKRAREILLRWGCFSEDYVERAELLCTRKDREERRWWYMPGLIVTVAALAPVVGMLPYTFSLEPGGVDPSTDKDTLNLISVWFGCTAR
jgi:hypothetical protein